MAWTYNSIRIYVQDLGADEKQTIARLQPLSGGTIKQVFGHEDAIWKLTGKVVGDTNMDALRALIDNGTSYTLAGNDGYSKSLLLSSLSFKRDPFAYQFIDTTQDCTTPVYTVNMELQE